MDITAKMEISVGQQQFIPPSCFFAAAAQSIQLSPTDSQCSSTSGSKQVKRHRSSSPELLRCKRRLNFAGFGYSLPPQQPHAVARRNERERNRVKLVNNGFATLREHVPNGAANKKMSKVETLRSAVEYIRALQHLLDEHDAVSAAFQSGVLSPTMSQNYSNDMNSMAGSPVSSYSSDEGSYHPLSPEEQELLDFTNWFWASHRFVVVTVINSLVLVIIFLWGVMVLLAVAVEVCCFCCCCFIVWSLIRPFLFFPSQDDVAVSSPQQTLEKGPVDPHALYEHKALRLRFGPLSPRPAMALQLALTGIGPLCQEPKDLKRRRFVLLSGEKKRLQCWNPSF